MLTTTSESTIPHGEGVYFQRLISPNTHSSIAREPELKINKNSGAFLKRTPAAVIAPECSTRGDERRWWWPERRAARRQNQAPPTRARNLQRGFAVGGDLDDAALAGERSRHVEVAFH